MNRSRRRTPASILLGLEAPRNGHDLSRNGHSADEDPPGKACPLVATSEERRLWMPWSTLSDRDRRPLTFEERTAAGTVLEWRVAPGSLGMPGPFDRLVFRACEWLALERRPTYAGLLGNFGIRAREICERICLSESLSVVPAVRTALLRLAQVEIHGRWKSGPRPASLPTMPLRLLTWVDQSHDHLPKSRMLRYERQVRFDPTFAQSVMGGGVVPMHWELWTALREPLDQRLLELLTHAFFRSPGRAEASFPWTDLCPLIPLRGVRSSDAARGALEGAHEALMRSGFLGEARWAGSGLAARVEYRAGRMAGAVRKRVLASSVVSVRSPQDVAKATG